jgi:NAD(P)-dependent dehydrogenase (short-subunit alcohol dehydrogenase family)
MQNAVLKDQVVLIIGAGREPGPSLAKAMAEEGAVVALNDLSPILLDPIAEAIRARKGQAKTYVGDAARGMPVRAMLDEVLEDWGRVDVLINNPRVQPESELLKMDEWDWQRTIEMNLNGPFTITKLAANMMREQGGGVIINIVDRNQRNLEAAGRAAYAASQAGLLSFSQAAAREFMAYNIRVYTLCPEELSPSSSQSAAPTASEPGDSITGLAVYLCSPAADHLPGQIFQVNRQE